MSLRDAKARVGLGGRVVALVLAALLFATPAQVRAEPSEADKDRAGQLMAEGDARFGRSDYAGALEAYGKADQIMHVPTTRMAVARTLERLGKLLEAREAAAQTSRMPMAQNEPTPFTRARAEAAQLLVALESRLPSLVLSVSGLPSGVVAEVKLDGAVLSREQLGVPQKLNPGAHTVSISADGYPEGVASLTLQERENKRVELTLRTPVSRPSASASEPAQPPRAQTPALAYIGFGVGGVGIVVGTVTGLLSMSRTSELKDKCGGDVCPDSYSGDLDTIKTLGWASNISFGVGLAGIAVGVGALFLSKGEERTQSALKSAPVRWSPLFGAQQIGLRGSF